MRTKRITTLLAALRKEGAHVVRELTAWASAERHKEERAFSDGELRELLDNGSLRGVEVTVKAWSGIDLPALQLAATTQLNEWKEDSKVEIARLNDSALNELRETLGQKMPIEDGWRPTVPTHGSITGLWEGIVCHATDGNLGAFTYYSGDMAHSWLAHVAEFNWQEDVEYLNHDGTTEWESVWRKGAPPTRYGMPKAAPVARKERKVRDALGLSKEQRELFDSL